MPSAASLRQSVALLLALALAATGCAVIRPEVALQDASLAGISTEKLDVTLDLSMENPNDIALPIDRLEWKLSLFGLDFADGIARIGKELPALGTLQLDVPLSISFKRALSVVDKVLTGKPIAYTVEGEMFFDTPFGPIGVDSTDEGSWKNPLGVFGELRLDGLRDLTQRLVDAAVDAPVSDVEAAPR